MYINEFICKPYLEKITSASIRVIDTETLTLISQWNPTENERITVATGNSFQVNDQRISFVEEYLFTVFSYHCFIDYYFDNK